MVLRDVLAGCRVLSAAGDLNCDVLGIAYDSRHVSAGFLFVAIKGLRTDGTQFAPQAIASGAVGVVSMAPPPAGLSTRWIQVDDDRAALAGISANFYGRPTERLHAIGITGTNGKTTTTWLVESVLNASGSPAAIFGTIEYRGPGFQFSAERTTPEAPELESMLARVVEGGWRYAVMEVSSHAIELRRVDGLHFDMAVFTNLSQDHLDLHGDMRSYFLAKKKLFQGLDGAPPRLMVLNRDDPHFEELRAIAPTHVISYGMSHASDVHPIRYTFGRNGTEAVFSSPAGEVQIHSGLMGKPNLYNVSAAVAVGAGFGISPESIARGIQQLRSVPGRFEAIDAGQPFRVIVDYAHTDDALEKVLHSAREITEGRVIVVFGCGGDRDRTKRPLMGEVAARGSDMAVVTSDNPRNEEPLAIIGEIEAGMRRAGAAAGTGYLVVADRREAIRVALQTAVSGDTVVVAGKGHEGYQTVRGQTVVFDDRVVVRELLDEIDAGRHH